MSMFIDLTRSNLEIAAQIMGSYNLLMASYAETDDEESDKKHNEDFDVMLNHLVKAGEKSGAEFTGSSHFQKYHDFTFQISDDYVTFRIYITGRVVKLKNNP